MNRSTQRTDKHPRERQSDTFTCRRCATALKTLPERDYCLTRPTRGPPWPPPTVSTCIRFVSPLEAVNPSLKRRPTALRRRYVRPPAASKTLYMVMYREIIPRDISPNLSHTETKAAVYAEKNIYYPTINYNLHTHVHPGEIRSSGAC